MRKAVRIELAEGDREVLECWSRSRSATVRLRERSRMVLMAAGGMTNTAIARELGTHTDKVGRWRRRYADKGIKGIEKERPRGGNHGGRCPKAQAALRTEIIRRTTQERPPDATHWSCRSMARAAGTTHSFVNTVWRSAGLKPHLWRTFKVSTDPRFEEKLQDVVALYLNPPDNAVVFSFDEKSSVQALDRTQPGLPLKPGRCGTMTHDYKRHGTTSLFAAMDVASGEVIGETYRRHRHQELLRFLRKVVKEVPKGREIHIILDNYSTHKHGKVREWAEGTGRVHFHFVPTSSSWLNLVERFFSTLTQKRIRRGVFHSVPHLESCLKEYVETYNENPRPFVWTKSAAQILEKVNRAPEGPRSRFRIDVLCFGHYTSSAHGQRTQHDLDRQRAAHLAQHQPEPGAEGTTSSSTQWGRSRRRTT